MKAKDIKLTSGKKVTDALGTEYTITKITRNRVWLTRPGMIAPSEGSPEMVKLWVARRGYAD